MDNKNLVAKILPLMRTQMDSFQHEIGQLLGGTRNIVKHDNPEVRKQTQERVDASVEGLLLVYQFAMWEQYVDRDVEKQWLDKEERTRIGAFRHVRHCVAHGFEGSRAKQFRTEFEEVMKSNDPLNLEWDEAEDTINLTRAHVAYPCYQFMSGLSQQLIARIATGAIRDGSVP